MIIETEAYRAPEDHASHAYGNRRTKRNTPMYQAGGIAYVYLSMEYTPSSTSSLTIMVFRMPF